MVVKLGSNISLEHIDGDYRIQTIECSVDDNDSEVVKLSFDDLDIDEIVQAQGSEDE